MKISMNINIKISSINSRLNSTTKEYSNKIINKMKTPPELDIWICHDFDEKNVVKMVITPTGGYPHGRMFEGVQTV